MFEQTRENLSLLFNRKAITTLRFESKIWISILGEFSGEHIGYAPAKVKIWAEAAPVSKGRYAITEKRLKTHKEFGVEGKSTLQTRGIKRIVDGKYRAIYTYDEARRVLESMEAQYQKDGYSPSSRQLLKGHLYTAKKNAVPKTA